MSDQEDVEQFLWDLERELSHLGGDERRELVREAEDRLHEVATAFAEHEGAEDVRWFHYVQATAEIGPPERLAAELTGEELPDRQESHRRLWIGAGLLVAALLGIVAYAWFTTGALEPVGAWGGQEADRTGRERLAFNVTPEAESVFLTLRFTPTTSNATAKITVLDGDANLVYEDEAVVEDHLETSEFVEGAPGTWRVIVDFDTYTGAWSLEAQQELD